MSIGHPFSVRSSHLHDAQVPRLQEKAPHQWEGQNKNQGERLDGDVFWFRCHHIFPVSLHVHRLLCLFQ